MNTQPAPKIATDAIQDELWYSDEYVNYIMDNCGGERIICNGDTLLEAMEDLYLWDSFLDSLGYELP